MSNKKILVILGPTASGKSELAVKLAKKFNGEIISADSRQVYEGLDIGTGKITKKEMCGVHHHLLDVADPRKQFSVSDFLMLTNQAIAEIVNKKKIPIVVGGTGFYIDALIGTVTFPNVPPNNKLREKLNKNSVETLFKILQRKDPKRAMTIDRYNKVRLIRALEIIEALGQVPQIRERLASTDFIFVGLKQNNIDKRICERLNSWIKNGLIKEVKNLHKNGLSWKRIDEIGLIYNNVAKHLQGKISKKEMIEKIFIDIRQYVKRQMTWFKRNKKIKWFKPEEYKEIERYARDMLR